MIFTSFLLPGRHNYALSGQASQSSNYGDFYASRANDGRLVSWGIDGITHTQERTDEWLMIDLGAYIYLAHMIMYNRDGYGCSGANCGKCAT